MRYPETLDIPYDVKIHPAFGDFVKFHKVNRNVMRAIVMELHRAKLAGRKKTSVKAIINYLRWNLYVETGKDYKINDKLTGIYTHIIYHNFAEYRLIIDIRKLTARPKVARAI